MQSKAVSGRAIDSVTQILAAYVAEAAPEALPEAVRKEAARTFLNWVGCAVGGARHETVDIALAALTPFSGPAQASVLGRSERLDALHAALINGISSHVFDFDDTHLRTVIHPGGPVVSALLAFAERREVRGPDFVNALVLGIEVECRIGNAVFPAHYDIGWHITGTAGVFGAAAAVGKLLKLDAERMAWAFGIAASQPVGLREMFGSMTKSFHPGRAAQNGMTASLLAARGFTSSSQALEAKRGWLNVLSARHDPAEITERTRHALRDSGQQLQAVRLRHRDSSGDRCLRAAPQSGRHRGRFDPFGCAPRASAGAGADRQDRAANGARGQVQRVPRSLCRADRG